MASTLDRLSILGIIITYIVVIVSLWGYNPAGSEFITARQYGANGSAGTDQTTELNALFAAAQQTGKPVKLGAGVFLFSSPLEITQGNGIHIEGAGTDQTTLLYNGSNTTSAALRFLCNDGLIENLTIDCNNLAGFGLSLDSTQYFIANNILIREVTRSCVRGEFSIGQTFNKCFFRDAINGYEAMVNDCNNLNFNNCIFFNLSGNGIRTQAGNHFQVGANGCIFEAIDGAGIYASNTSNLSVTNCYFEDVGAVGDTFSGNVPGLNITAPLTIKSNIMLNGSLVISTEQDSLVAFTPCRGINVIGNFFSNAVTDYLVAATSVEGLYIAGNYSKNSGQTDYLLGVVNNGFSNSEDNITDISMHGNNGFEDCVSLIDVKNGETNSGLHYCECSNAHKGNMVKDPTTWGQLTAIGEGSIALDASKVNGQDVWSLSGSTNTDLLGMSISLADYPAIQGKTCIFYFKAKSDQGTPTSAIRIQYDIGSGFQNARSVSLAATTTEYKTYSVAIPMPVSGTVEFGINGESLAGGENILFTEPVFSQIGGAQ